MSKKQLLRKGFILLTVLAMVLTMATVNVFAAAVATHHTTTTYNLGDSTVTVTSAVTGLTEDQQITYLAYNKLELSEGNITPASIVYIDQQAYDTTNPASNTFEYTAALDEIGTTQVRFGTNSAIDTITNADETVEQQINAYNVSTEVGQGLGAVSIKQGNGSLPGSVARKALGNKNCIFEVRPDAGQRVASIVRSDGKPVDMSGLIVKPDGGIDYSTADFSNNFKITAYFDTIDESVTEDDIFDASKFRGGIGANMITTYSTAKVRGSVESYEYGILFYYDENEFAAFDFDDSYLGANVAGTITDGITGVNKYRALGKGNDGKFAVQLNDPSSAFLSRNGGVFYTRPYLAVKEDGASDYVIQYGEPTRFPTDI